MSLTTFQDDGEHDENKESIAELGFGEPVTAQLLALYEYHQASGMSPEQAYNLILTALKVKTRSFSPYSAESPQAQEWKQE